MADTISEVNETVGVTTKNVVESVENGDNVKKVDGDVDVKGDDKNGQSDVDKKSENKEGNDEKEIESADEVCTLGKASENGKVTENGNKDSLVEKGLEVVADVCGIKRKSEVALDETEANGGETEKKAKLDEASAVEASNGEAKAE